MFRPKYYKDAWDVVIVLLSILIAAMAVLWAGQAAGQEEPDETKVELIASLWEGVFHAAEHDGRQPFVDVGSHVMPDTLIGCIDVDIMQPHRRINVYAGFQGTVIQVLVEDGEFVSAGQALMAIKLDPDYVLAQP